MLMKAQSGIEYLITYGWALVGLGVVSGALFSYYSPSCNVETDVFHPEFRVEDAGVTSDNQLQLAMRSASNDRITITGVEINGAGDVTQNRDLVLEPGETKAYEVAQGEPTSNCAEAEMRINYDIGVVKNQHVSGTIQLPVELVEAIIDYLSAGGGEISTLRVNSTLKTDSGGICFGDNCNLTTVETDERVARSGDRLQGALLTDRLEFNCIGNNCASETGTLSGNVSSQNNTMDGTLYLSDVLHIQTLRIRSYQ